MMREWATVVSWDNGIATLRCNPELGCGACRAKATCSVRMMNNVKSEHVLEFKLPIEQYLQIGQKVELGISEANLLQSALLIYLVPLLGMFIGACLSHGFVGDNLSVIIGTLLGGVIGFFVARFYARKLEKKHFYRPVILQIALHTETY